MALDEVTRLVNEKDDAKRVHATLHDMYLRDGADNPSYSDFDEKFRLQLRNRGLDDSAIDAVTESIDHELTLEGGNFENDPKKFAEDFIREERWVPPVAAAPAEQQFVDVDGFVRSPSGQLFLSDRTTEVFEHTGYPGQAVCYDRQNQLYQHGQPYVPFVDVDGFVRNGAGQMFLADRTTEVFEHTGYPGAAVYYDRQNQLYQHGQPYAPVVAEETAAEPVNLANDAEIAELLDSPSNYAELTKAVADGDLAIEFDDEDISDFSSDMFLNVS
jgi:hypothetical protein